MLQSRRLELFSIAMITFFCSHDLLGQIALYKRAMLHELDITQECRVKRRSYGEHQLWICKLMIHLCCFPKRPNFPPKRLTVPKIMKLSPNNRTTPKRCNFPIYELCPKRYVTSPKERGGALSLCGTMWH